MARYRCPTCESQFIRRSRHPHRQDWLLSCLHLFPFRCQICRRRFLNFIGRLLISRKPDTGQDHREYYRLSAQIPVNFTGDKMMGDGCVTDLTVQGCLVQTQVPVNLGSVLSLTLFTSDHDIPIDVAKAIIRHKTRKVFGVEFLHLHPQQEKSLRLRMRIIMAGASRP